MKTLIAALGAVAMTLTGIAATATPASADGYYRHHGGYYGGRGRHYRHGGGDALAAGAIGLGVGAIIGGALAAPRAYDDGYYGRGYRGGYIVNEGPVSPRYRPVPVYRGYSHVDACYARYRTYDARSNTFIGNDGRAHQCRL